MSKNVSFSSFIVYKYFFTQLISSKFFRRQSLIGQLFKKYGTLLHKIFHTHSQGQVRNVEVGSSRHGAAEINLTRNYEVAGSIPGLSLWVKDLALVQAVV